MSTQAAEPVTVQERLQELERQSHRLRVVAWISLGLAAITTLAIFAIIVGWCPHLGAGQGYFGMVNIQANPGGLFLNLQDQNGNSLARLRDNYGTLELVLFSDVVVCDEYQHARARLTVDKKGVRLKHVAEEGKPIGPEP